MELNNSCCIFGHREVEKTNELTLRLKSVFEDLIINKKVNCFLFGGFGAFDDLCHEVITELKRKYSYIKRVYVCEDYKFIDRPHKRPKWLTNEDYEEFTYFEMRYTGFYQRIYFRNCEIINNSDYCVFYVDINQKYSGAKKALEYAIKKKKDYINIFDTT